MLNNTVMFSKHAAERLKDRLGISVAPGSEYPLPDELVQCNDYYRRHPTTNHLLETWVHTKGIFALIIDQSTRMVITVLTKEQKHLYNNQYDNILRQLKH